MRRLLGISALAAGQAVGCKMDSKSDWGGVDTANDENGVDDDVGGDSADTGQEMGAIYWSLAARLVVVKGAVAADQSTLEVRLFAADLAQLCATSTTVAAVAPVESKEAEIYVWMEVTAGEWDEGCAKYPGDAPPFTDLLLGVGELHDDIAALLGMLDGVDESAVGTLNGAYASLDGGVTNYVFGAAGTEEAFQGEGEALTADAEALTDGTWLLRPIYLFSTAE